MSQVSSIVPIDRSSVHRICSGQVILDLATAVKECVENSLDAGAGKIEIKMKDYGLTSITITDDGSGIDPSNYEALTLKYHTSKLKDFNDLEQLTSFGFRGEALSSLCSLANVTIITKTQNEEQATKLAFNLDGEIISRTPCIKAVGTTIILKDIFSSVPVRLQEFKKNIKREYSKTQLLMQEYGLICVGVSLTLLSYNSKTQKAKSIISTTGSSFLNNFAEIFGKKDSIDNLDTIKLENSKLNITINGYFSKGNQGSGRASPDRQFFFVNSRPVDLPSVAKILNQIFKNFNNKQYPIIILNLLLPTDSYDINITPNKRKIFLHKETEILNFIEKDVGEHYFKTYSQSIKLTHSQDSLGASQDWISNDSQNSPESHPFLDDIFQQFKKKPSQNDLDFIPSFSPKKKSTVQNGRINFEKIRNNQNKQNKNNSQNDTYVNNSQSESNSEDNNNNNDQKSKKRKRETSPDLLLDISDDEKNEINIIAESPKEKTKDGIQYTAPLLELRRKLEKNKHKNDDTVLYRDSKVVVINDANDAYVDNSKENINPLRKELKVHFDKNKSEKLFKLLEEQDKNVLSQSSETPLFKNKIGETSQESAEDELTTVFKKTDFKAMKVIGQFNAGFIIASLGSNLFIIDQHAGHEKVNYEALKQTTIIKRQPLIAPTKMAFTPEEEMIVLDSKDIFYKNGFDFSTDADAKPGTQLSLLSYPFSKNTEFGVRDIYELITLLRESPNQMVYLPRINSMYASRACRKSVMMGTPLSKDQMEKILDQLSSLENPWSCPHSRPVLRYLYNFKKLKNAQQENRKL